MKVTRLLTAVLLPLTIAAVATPVHADLLVQSLEIGVGAEVIGPPRVEDLSFGMGLPTLITATAETSDQRAFAMQSKNGFFQNYASSNGQNHDAAPNISAGESFFHLVVGADSPNTPLVINFVFLGAQAVGTAYYGAGDMRIRLSPLISAGFNGAVTEVWGFQDTVELNAFGNPNWTRTRDFQVDMLGVGLPTETETHDDYSSGFTTSCSLVLDAFAFTLDFGVLQPGETFELDYDSFVETKGTLTYPGPQASAVASLVDPFSLGNDPPLQLAVQGLTLPPIQAAGAAAPEPATCALVVTGLLPLLKYRGLKSRLLQFKSAYAD